MMSYFDPTKGAGKGAGAGKGKGKGGLGGVYVVESPDEFIHELALSRSRSTRRMAEAGEGEGGGGRGGDGGGDGGGGGGPRDGSYGNGSSGVAAGSDNMNLPFDAPALQPLKNALQGHYYLIYTMFNYYATLGSGNGFSLQLNAFSQYV